ncbi:MAG: hypothetical protein HYR89_03530 [Actinobacteria bacterium]|nr:hypothetical protein [Actinomycetota bacterium]
MGRLMKWLRSSPDVEADPGRLVTLTLGTDIHRSYLVADACAARGLRVELLTSEMGAHPHTPGVEQRMLVRSEDLDAVRDVLSEQDASWSRRTVAKLVRVVRVLGPVWAAFAIGMAVVALPDVNSDAVWVVTLAAIVAAAASVAAGFTVVRRPRLAGALLVVAAFTAPTFAAIWLNVIPLLIGLVLVARAEVHTPVVRRKCVDVLED